MKTYKYSKAAATVLLIICLSATAATIYLFIQNKHLLWKSLLSNDNSGEEKLAIGLFVILGFFLINSLALFSRSITLDYNKIIFKGNFKRGHFFSKFDLEYKQIAQIDRNPLTKSIRIKTTDGKFYFPGYFTVDYKEFCGELCRQVRKANPEAYIDNYFDKSYLI